MALNPETLFDRQFKPIRHHYTLRDSQIYALGVGLGNDPMNTDALRYVYEGESGDELVAMPSMANVLAYPGFWARDHDTGITWKKLLHAEQSFVLHEPLASEGDLIGQTRVTHLWDRGVDKGAFMQQVRELRDAKDDRLLATVSQLTLLRADGGFVKPGSDGGPLPPHLIPGRTPDVVCSLPTSSQAALIYRLSGDFNPLHADPQVAKAAGFGRPILHGMSTMGCALHAVLHSILGYDARRVRGMRVRFTAPVIPGDTLKTHMWVDGDVVSLQTTAVERNVIVLNHSRVDLQ
jgi:acyl dehydratase